ncbi:MAG: heat shock protein HspQ [Sphingomonadales bacterium]
MAYKSTTHIPDQSGTPSFPLAKFNIGDVVKHRVFPFRGVIFDVDPIFNNTEEWWESIPENVRPSKDQPYYHLLAENEDGSYIAYVSQQNLLTDDSGVPVKHPDIPIVFDQDAQGRYMLRQQHTH